jgi:hypothetical protein
MACYAAQQWLAFTYGHDLRGTLHPRNLVTDKV